MQMQIPELFFLNGPLNAEKEQEEILVNQTTVCCSD
jgi:hypothetical protein